MEISHPNHQELTPEELQELEKLKRIIEQATADGVVTQYERDRIFQQVWADGKPTFEELELIRTMVSEKVASGELRMDYF